MKGCIICHTTKIIQFPAAMIISCYNHYKYRALLKDYNICNIMWFDINELKTVVQLTELFIKISDLVKINL